MSEILFSFSAFVSSKMMKERIIILKRRKNNFYGVVLAPLAESLWCQMRGGSRKTERQT